MNIERKYKIIFREEQYYYIEGSTKSFLIMQFIEISPFYIFKILFKKGKYDDGADDKHLYGICDKDRNVCHKPIYECLYEPSISYSNPFLLNYKVTHRIDGFHPNHINGLLSIEHNAVIEINNDIINTSFDAIYKDITYYVGMKCCNYRKWHLYFLGNEINIFGKSDQINDFEYDEILNYGNGKGLCVKASNTNTTHWYFKIMSDKWMRFNEIDDCQDLTIDNYGIIFEKQKKFGIINLKGHLILQPIYKKIESYDNLFIVTNDQNKKALYKEHMSLPRSDSFNWNYRFEVSESYIQILDFEYDTILLMGEFAVVEKDKIFSIFDIENRRFKKIYPLPENWIPIPSSLGEGYIGAYKKNTDFIVCNGKAKIHKKARGFFDINGKPLILLDSSYDIETKFIDGSASLRKLNIDGPDKFYLLSKKGVLFYDDDRSKEEYRQYKYNLRYRDNYEDSSSSYNNMYYNENLDFDQQDQDFWESL